MQLNEFDRPSIKIHRQLNPKLWEQNHLKPDIRKKCLDIAKEFESFIGLDDLDIVDVIITGSNAAYAYTDHSDLDIHLMVNGTPDLAQRQLYDAKKGLWNYQHDIVIKGLPVEMYVQGTDEAHESNGMYSILKQKWLKIPSKTKPQIDDAGVQAKVRHMTNAIQSALESDVLDMARAIKDKITKMRKQGLAATGEWSTENIAFKQIRNSGLIDDLAQHILSLEDQELSLERLGETVSETFNTPYQLKPYETAPHYVSFTAKTENEDDIMIYFSKEMDDDDFDENPVEQDSIWEMVFNVNGSYDIRNKGNAFKIFATAALALDTFLKMPQGNDADQLYFTAKEPSRKKLYQRFAQLMHTQFGLSPSRYSLPHKFIFDIN